MSDPNNPNVDKRSTPQWSLYQRENFWKPNTGEVPPFNTGGIGYSSSPFNRTDIWQNPANLKSSQKRSSLKADGQYNPHRSDSETPGAVF